MLTSLGVAVILASAPAPAAPRPTTAGFSERFADVNGVRLRYSIGGKGAPVVLLHGFAQTGLMDLVAFLDAAPVPPAP